MARNLTPVLKRCRSLDLSPAVLGIRKKPSIRNKNMNQRRKISEYGLQLREKQRAKFIYGVLEKQFRRLYERAAKAPGITGETLLCLLEQRLDNVVYRAGLVRTRPEARQFVAHGHVLVDGRRVDIPSYEVHPGQVVSIREKTRASDHFKALQTETEGMLVPKWLSVDRGTASVDVIQLPAREDLDFEIQEHLIVELYSK